MFFHVRGDFLFLPQRSTMYDPAVEKTFGPKSPLGLALKENTVLSQGMLPQLFQWTLETLANNSTVKLRKRKHLPQFGNPEIMKISFIFWKFGKGFFREQKKLCRVKKSCDIHRYKKLIKKQENFYFVKIIYKC